RAITKLEELGGEFRRQFFSRRTRRGRPKARVAKPKPVVRNKVVEVSPKDPNYTEKNRGRVEVRVWADPYWPQAERRQRVPVADEELYYAVLHGAAKGPVDGVMPSGPVHLVETWHNPVKNF